MAVMFAPLLNDGSQLNDGYHNVQVSNAASNDFLSNLGYPTAVPGQAQGVTMYAAFEAFILTPTYAGFSQAKKDLYEEARIAIGAGARIESGIIAWR